MNPSDTRKGKRSLGKRNRSKEENSIKEAQENEN